MKIYPEIYMNDEKCCFGCSMFVFSLGVYIVCIFVILSYELLYCSKNDKSIHSCIRSMNVPVMLLYSLFVCFCVLFCKMIMNHIKHRRRPPRTLDVP